MAGDVIGRFLQRVGLKPPQRCSNRLNSLEAVWSNLLELLGIGGELKELSG
ncbi:hypothetical protein [Belnapia rosea]|uniref:hypothetical protein n=1 Tax=Belnapia rosea TaxID=938405 RepID=UPI001C40A244|nr:hypothetical protein [Belnapia rosea]